MTEELLLRLIPFLNVTEVNFVGKSQIVVKTVENFYVEIKFTEKKIMRGYLSCDELPISIEEKISMPLSQQFEMELGALVSVMLTKFHGFKFDMVLD